MKDLEILMEKGFDIIVSGKVVEHFDNIEKARAFQKTKPHSILRYWTKVEEKEDE